MYFMSQTGDLRCPMQKRGCFVGGATRVGVGAGGAGKVDGMVAGDGEVGTPMIGGSVGVGVAGGGGMIIARPAASPLLEV
jgi:hypothetical protein